MRTMSKIRNRRRESGIALLIAIFILLLISVVAIALIISSGTESALAGNYRSSTGVYYAAVAGLEEVRARLRPSDPNSFKNTTSNFIPPSGTPIAVCAPIYVINPGGVTVVPWDPTNPFYDIEFGQEYGGICGAIPNPSPNTLSVWNRSPLNGLPFSGPLYKWVRINGVSEQSLNLDTCPHDTTVNPALIYYGVVPVCNPSSPNLNDTATGAQVLELTALAVLPNGSQKLVQYLVAPVPLNLSFPAPLTLDGNNVQFSATTSNNFWISGVDQGSVGTCSPGAAAITAVGYTNSGDSSQANIVNAIPSGPSPTPDLRTHYTNVMPPPPPPTTPDVGLVSVSWPIGCPGCSLTTVAGLNALVQAITQNADVVINGAATQSNMPSAMSASNPMTIVVNGDLTFNGWHNTGYGLLLVTGEFTYDPDASWDGMVLVIGTGKIYSHQSGTGQILGALFLARTLDASNNPLPAGSAPISPFFDFTSSSGSSGIYYSSCWIQAATPSLGYKILSFHEIAQ